MKRTADWIMYAILDAIVDMFFSFVQHVRSDKNNKNSLNIYIYTHILTLLRRLIWKSIR